MPAGAGSRSLFRCGLTGGYEGHREGFDVSSVAVIREEPDVDRLRKQKLQALDEIKIRDRIACKVRDRDIDCSFEGG